MIYKALFIAVLAVVIVFPLTMMYQLGFFLHYYQHYPGTCRQLQGASFGSEDFQVLSSGITFITSGFAWPYSSSNQMEWLRKNNIKGRILFYDFNEPKAGARELKIKPSKSFKMDTFRPHGISILEDKVKGEHLLYVINHAMPEPDRVEKFRYLPKTGELVHEKSFQSDLFRSTNDLAVTGEDKFYITNYLYYLSKGMSFVEQLFKLNFGSILYFDGNNYKTVETAVCGANGVTLSNDGRHLYVAFPLKQTIHVYERKPDDTIQLVQNVPVYSGCDNIHMSQDGKSFYTGCHPIGYKTVQHFEDPPNDKAHSQALQFKLSNGKIHPEEGTELFYDHGKLISGSSVAAVYKNKLLIGSVLDQAAVCDLGAPEL